ncbi:putative signaling protein [Fundidesulfovibrio magnetotacticus]|uniref:Putative signaling protein n=1 Tax=Fundidesulfovibrio magnetotacticus TaxID=2730080 RepID=A0A6V8LZE7_9BACT|nr:sensor domain-containing diguanylate cyclase [Fundidesulfovibrio magnetotacticus]GFK95389.1 putative signaling protein [Fundidesulfovibrio magnetotacticus]
MRDADHRADLSQDVLYSIIETQTEVARLGLDLGAIMELVAGRVQNLAGAAGAIVELAEGEEMVYRAATGLAAGQLGLRLRRESSLSGLCVAGGKALACDDSEDDPRVDREACRKVGLRSMVVAPLVHGETPVGVLKIVSPEPRVFHAEHLRILELMSGLIGAAMYFSAKYEVRELYRLATRDSLTGLANRALFYDRLRLCLAQAGRNEKPVGVLNFDLDGLKAINDTHGHRAGDAAIREAGQRARSATRDADTVARLGGDEFGVILAEAPDRQSAQQAAARIAREIRKPFLFEDARLALDASIGLALFPEDARDLENLLEKADRAMYREKRGRKASNAPR